MFHEGTMEDWGKKEIATLNVGSEQAVPDRCFYRTMEEPSERQLMKDYEHTGMAHSVVA